MHAVAPPFVRWVSGWVGEWWVSGWCFAEDGEGVKGSEGKDVSKLFNVLEVRFQV